MSTAVTENAGLGPCDLKDPVWVKMSAITGVIGKKRKKTDTKPQSQINKCLNEKRRREQENIYLEELAELISAGFADMSSLSVKPDKCAILQETVNQIRRIKQQEASNSDAVQQGEVSSSKPSILANEFWGPLLLEALEGFLFVVNTEGKVEFVTGNVHHFIKYTQDDIIGKSIYNILHHGDHARFSSTLLPMSIGWPSDPQPQSRKRSFNCRLLVKPPDDQDETMEEKQQRVSKYENMQVSSISFPNEKTEGGDVSSESSEVGPCLVCLARRIPLNEKPGGSSVEQFTMKLDTGGKIIGVDTSGVSSTYSQYLNKDLIGSLLQEMCHRSDFHMVTNHLKETLNSGNSTSGIYRLRVTMPDKYVHVQTKSKLYKSDSVSQETDFIMAVHSIIGPLQEHATAGNQNNVGNPVGSGNPNEGYLEDTKDSKEGLEIGGGANSGGSGPNHVLSDCGDVPPESGRLRTLLTKRHSSDDGASTSAGDSLDGDSDSRNKHRILKGLLNQEDEDDGREDTVGGSGVSGLLGGRLTGSSSMADTPKVPGDNKMLLRLLNEKSDDDDMEEKRKKQNELFQKLFKGQPEGRKQHLSNMNFESSQHNDDTLLETLGFNTNSPSPPSTTDSMNDLGQSYIGVRKRSIEDGDDGIPSKKSGSDNSSYCPNQCVVSSSGSMGSSKLWEKNRMLASLLAQQPPQPTVIPPINPSIITATPQEKLPRVKQPAPSAWSGGSLRPVSCSASTRTTMSNQEATQRQVHNRLQLQNKQQLAGSYPILSPSTSESSITLTSASPMNTMSATINQVQNPGGQMQQKLHVGSIAQPSVSLSQSVQINQMDSSFPSTPVSNVSSSCGDFRTGSPLMDSQSSDPVLSRLLEEVIDSLPDTASSVSDESSVINILGAITLPSPTSTSSGGQDMNAKMAINAIQKLLMECETDVKSPSSPTISLPGTPPAYTSPAVSANQTTQQSAFTHPPMYPNRPKFSNPQASGTQHASQLNVRAAAPQYGVAASGTLTGPNSNQFADTTNSVRQCDISNVDRPQIPLAQQSLAQRRKTLQTLQAQQLQRLRLLQQQQQQQLLVPSNANAIGDQLSPGGSLQNIDSLLNTTVAPNVIVQRSSSVPDSQLSPNYSGQMLNSPLGAGSTQISPGQRLNQQPYSPHSQLTSPLNQQQGFSSANSGLNNFTGNQQGPQARLSPHPPGQLPPFQQSQLSPRISQGQQGYPPMSQSIMSQATQSQSNSNWSHSASRLSMQQQQNPMLNAQLTGNFGGSRGFVQQQRQQLPPVRSLPSPSASASRQSPFQQGIDANQQFSPSPSPTSNTSNPGAVSYQTPGQFQQLRLQRAISAGGVGGQVPGGVNSSRHYGMNKDHHPLLSPGHPMSPQFHHSSMGDHHHGMMYPTADPFCFDQQSLQMYGASLTSGGDRVRPQPHTPTNQQPGGGNGMPSEYVRQELRAVVGARSQQSQQGPQGQPTGQGSRQLNPGQVNPADLDALGLSLELPTSGTSDSPKLWGNLGSDMGSGSQVTLPSPQQGLSSSSSRGPMEEGPRPGDQKSSLLQKLLSE